MTAHEAIVIGGGHNGLVRAGSLARASREVCKIQGTPILEELELGKHGLELIYHDALWHVPFLAGTAITFYREVERSKSIAQASPEAAAACPHFLEA